MGVRATAVQSAARMVLSPVVVRSEHGVRQRSECARLVINLPRARLFFLRRTLPAEAAVLYGAAVSAR
jgi:hypothetical protein